MKIRENISVEKASCKCHFHLNVVGYENKVANWWKIENIFAGLSLYISENFLGYLKFKHWPKRLRELFLIDIQLKTNLPWIFFMKWNRGSRPSISFGYIFYLFIRLLFFWQILHHIYCQVVYDHVLYYLPCAKDTLVKRCRALVVQHQRDLGDEPMQNLQKGTNFLGHLVFTAFNIKAF